VPPTSKPKVRRGTSIYDRDAEGTGKRTAPTTATPERDLFSAVEENGGEEIATAPGGMVYGLTLVSVENLSLYNPSWYEVIAHAPSRRRTKKYTTVQEAEAACRAANAALLDEARQAVARLEKVLAEPVAVNRD
jgi:hypothetical protein